jgi:hypothetical protein
MLKRNGIYVGERGLPDAHDIDHVQDLNWGAEDCERNMWPLKHEQGERPQRKSRVGAVSG